MHPSPSGQESTQPSTSPSDPRPALFLTGGAGFVGSALVARLAQAGWSDVTLLIRRAGPAMSLPAGWRTVPGDLLASRDWASAIKPGAIVVHLAALTGKAKRAEFERVNVAGTAALLEAARKASARGVVFVSSVAAGYRDKRYAWYARSKERAEALVRDSGLPFTIVRPTQVMGDGSPVAAALGRLANLPVPIVFGDGQVLAQPIAVADLAERLLAILNEPQTGRTMTVGGPEAVAMRTVIERLRDPARPKRTVRSIPIEPLRTVLGLLEPLVGGLLPFTAGQLSAFGNDGAAGASP